jgi:hypothetical protein
MGLRKKIVSSVEVACLLQTSRNMETLVAIVTHLGEGLNLKTLLTLKEQMFLIFLMGIRRPTV